jgi:hypothetical protein
VKDCVNTFERPCKRYAIAKFTDMQVYTVRGCSVLRDSSETSNAHTIFCESPAKIGTDETSTA